MLWVQPWKDRKEKKKKDWEREREREDLNPWIPIFFQDSIYFYNKKLKEVECFLISLYSKTKFNVCLEIIKHKRVSKKKKKMEETAMYREDCIELNSCFPKSCLLKNLSMWPYLEITFFWYNQVKMRSFWIKADPNTMAVILIKGGKLGQSLLRGKMAWEDGGRD